MHTKQKHNLIKPCPCCNKEADWVDLKMHHGILWQISCNACGLASFPHEHRSTTLKYWNTRPKGFAQHAIGYSILFLSLVGIIFFIIGMSVAI